LSQKEAIRLQAVEPPNRASRCLRSLPQVSRAYTLKRFGVLIKGDFHMTLKTFAYTTQKPIDGAAFGQPEDATLIACWDEHPNLHGWMFNLYDEKVKGNIRFPYYCGQGVHLTVSDLDALEALVNEEALPDWSENPYGTQSTPEHKADDLLFIRNARKAIVEGAYVFYTSLWDY
jgi:hypothetical protein